MLKKKNREDSNWWKWGWAFWAQELSRELAVKTYYGLTRAGAMFQPERDCKVFQTLTWSLEGQGDLGGTESSWVGVAVMLFSFVFSFNQAFIWRWSKAGTVFRKSSRRWMSKSPLPRTFSVLVPNFRAVFFFWLLTPHLTNVLWENFQSDILGLLFIYVYMCASLCVQTCAGSHGGQRRNWIPWSYS